MNGLENLLSAEVQCHPSSGSLGRLRSQAFRTLVLRTLVLRTLVLRTLVLRTLVLRTLVLRTLVLRSSRAAACRVSRGQLHVPAENRRRQLIPHTGQEQFGPIRPRLRLRTGRSRGRRFRAGLGQCPPVKLAPHIALGKNALHRVVIAQEKRRLVGLYSLPLARPPHPGERNLP